MSYDIEIYCALEPEPPASLSGKGWQLLVSGPLEIEAEDVLDSVRPLISETSFAPIPVEPPLAAWIGRDLAGAEAADRFD